MIFTIFCLLHKIFGEEDEKFLPELLPEGEFRDFFFGLLKTIKTFSTLGVVLLIVISFLLVLSSILCIWCGRRKNLKHEVEVREKFEYVLTLPLGGVSEEEKQPEEEEGEIEEEEKQPDEPSTVKDPEPSGNEKSRAFQEETPVNEKDIAPLEEPGDAGDKFAGEEDKTDAKHTPGEEELNTTAEMEKNAIINEQLEGKAAVKEDDEQVDDEKAIEVEVENRPVVETKRSDLEEDEEPAEAEADEPVTVEVDTAESPEAETVEADTADVDAETVEADNTAETAGADTCSPFSAMGEDRSFDTVFPRELNTDEIPDWDGSYVDNGSIII